MLYPLSYEGGVSTIAQPIRLAVGQRATDTVPRCLLHPC